jgi:hypothetical protein
MCGFLLSIPSSTFLTSQNPNYESLINNLYFKKSLAKIGLSHQKLQTFEQKPGDISHRDMFLKNNIIIGFATPIQTQILHNSFLYVFILYLV